jgi:hypothetical protein
MRFGKFYGDPIFGHSQTAFVRGDLVRLDRVLGEHVDELVKILKAADEKGEVELSDEISHDTVRALVSDTTIEQVLHGSEIAPDLGTKCFGTPAQAKKAHRNSLIRANFVLLESGGFPTLCQ